MIAIEGYLLREDEANLLKEMIMKVSKTQIESCKEKLEEMKKAGAEIMNRIAQKAILGGVLGLGLGAIAGGTACAVLGKLTGGGEVYVAIGVVIFGVAGIVGGTVFEFKNIACEYLSSKGNNPVATSNKEAKQVVEYIR